MEKKIENLKLLAVCSQFVVFWRQFCYVVNRLRVLWRSTSVCKGWIAAVKAEQVQLVYLMVTAHCGFLLVLISQNFTKRLWLTMCPFMRFVFCCALFVTMSWQFLVCFLLNPFLFFLFWKLQWYGWVKKQLWLAALQYHKDLKAQAATVTPTSPPPVKTTSTPTSPAALSTPSTSQPSTPRTPVGPLSPKTATPTTPATTPSSVTPPKPSGPAFYRPLELNDGLSVSHPLTHPLQQQPLYAYQPPTSPTPSPPPQKPQPLTQVKRLQPQPQQSQQQRMTFDALKQSMKGKAFSLLTAVAAQTAPEIPPHYHPHRANGTTPAAARSPPTTTATTNGTATKPAVKKTTKVVPMKEMTKAKSNESNSDSNTPKPQQMTNS